MRRILGLCIVVVAFAGIACEPYSPAAATDLPPVADGGNPQPPN